MRSYLILIAPIMKRLFILVAIFIVQNTGAQTPVEEHGQLSVQGKYIVNNNSDPVQLKGMSLFWSNWGGAFYNYNAIKWMRDDWKIQVIRAAMAVEGNDEGWGYLDNAEGRVTERAKIDSVIKAAEQLGLYVIVDWHSHHAHEEVDSAVAFFADIAKTYGHLPNIIYEIYNEPEQIDWLTVIKPYLEELIDTIRVHDANNIILCGSSTWSQDLDVVAKDPIETDDNIAYSLHYYAVSHKQPLRDKVQIAIDSGIAIFVSEFGTVAVSANGYVDVESTNDWFQLLDENEIGWCNWSMNDKDELASALKLGASVNGGWAEDEFTESGMFIYNKLHFEYYSTHIQANSKPMLFYQPQSMVEKEGESFELRVIAVSPDTLEYQWYHNNEVIEYATDSIYRIDTYEASDSGYYYVVVTNSNGVVNSDTAYLEIMIREPFDGVIPIPGVIEAENFDKGGNDFTYFDADEENKGGEYRVNEGVDIDKSVEEGGYQVAFLETREWLEYTVNVAAGGEYLLVAHVSSPNGGGRMRVKFQNGGVQYLGIPTSESTTESMVSYATIDLIAGEQIVQLMVLDANSPKDFSIDKIEVRLFDGTYPTNNSEVPVLVDNLYPNPTPNVVTIETAEEAFVEVFYGMTRIDAFESKGAIQYSLEEYPAGLYFFKFSVDGNILVKKVIKH